MKGISPLIGSVLLVAFTLAVAGLVSVFITTFAEDTSSQTTAKGETTVDCTFARISFTDDDVENGLPASLEVTALNSGQESLYEMEMVAEIDGVSHIYSPTSATQRTASNPWLPGETIVIAANITDSPSGSLEYVTIISKPCPNNARRRVEI